LPELIRRVAGQLQKSGQHRQLIVVQFDDIGPFEGGPHDLRRIEVLAEVDIEDLDSGRRQVAKKIIDNPP